MNVRRAGHDDVPVIAGFMAAMAAETEDRPLDQDTVRRGITHTLDHPEDAIYLVLEAQDAVRACLMLTFEWSDWRAGRFWWIQSVFVEPAWRRRGLYTHLHAAVRTLAHADPLACGIRLYVERDNRVAQYTYRALGMHETGYRLYEEPFVQG